jgi:vacuolar-type H+-ATPase subunit H
VQHSIEASRTEAVDRFVARLREQIVPMLSEAKESLQKLQGAELALRKESDEIFAGLENQLAYSTNEILTRSQEDLEKNSAAIAARAGETLQKLSQDFEYAARNNANLLLASMSSDVAQTLQEKVAEASREFSTGLDGCTKNYLESLGKSIAEIPQKLPGRPRQ